MGIVVIGACFVDVKGFPEHLYLPTGRNAGHIEYVHGGVARNVVENIANVELRPTFISIVEEEGLGNEVVRKLRNHKVNTNYICNVAGGMGTFLAIFDENGDLAGSISQRPDLSPILDILKENGDEIILNCDSVVLEADIDNSIVNYVFRLARKYNKKVYPIVSNMGEMLNRRDFVRNYDCFICNEIEAGQLFNDDFTSDDTDELMKKLVDRVKAAEIKNMVVTLGSKGSIYVDIDGNCGLVPAKNVVVKDTVGAGDAFCSGMVMGLTYGKSLAEACEMGTYLASTVIQTSKNTIPRFMPREIGLDIDVED